MQLDVKAFVDSLSVMGLGMLGIFTVIVVIILCVAALCRLFPAKEKEESQN